MKNFGSALVNLALMASPLSAGGASSAYYASRRASYARNNAYLVDEGLRALSSAEWSKRKSKAVSSGADAVTEIDVDELVLNKRAAIRELVIVDSNVRNAKLFSRLAKPGVEVVSIPANSRGFDELMTTLQGYEGLEAVHLFSHNHAGQLLLGNQIIDTETVQNTVESINTFNQSIVEGGELLVYNCKLENHNHENDFLEIIKGNVDAKVRSVDTDHSIFAEDLELSLNKGDINAKPNPGSIALNALDFAFTGTIQFDQVKTAGSYTGDNTNNAEFYTSASKEHILVADGTSFGTGSYYQAAANEDGVYTHLSGETNLRLSFSLGETFDVTGTSSIYVWNAVGQSARTFTFTSSSGVMATSGSINGGTGAYVSLSANNTGITHVDITGSASFYAHFSLFKVANVGSATPEINLKGNNVSIVDGDVSPASGDHTDFGSTGSSAGANIVRTFTIENTGTGALDLTGSPNVTISGTNAADFTVNSQPGSDPVSAGNTTTFQVTFNPSAEGLRTATVTITNDDADEGTYDFAIQGTGSDDTAPSAPSTPNMTTATDSGNEEHTAGASSDNLTNDLTPTFEGTAESGSTVKIFSNVDGQVGSGTATGGNYSITVSTLTAGAHTITATATDAATNASGSSSGLSINIDVTQPTVSVSTTSSDPTNDNPIPVTITFNSEAENMKEGDLTVVNGTTGDFASADSTTFTVNVTPSGNGTVQVSVGAGQAFDRAGNGNTVSNTLSLTYDGTAPSISSVSLDGNNGFIDVTFDNGVYNTNGGSGALQTSDFALSITGGTATSPSVTSVTTTGGAGLSGGETTIRVNFSMTGTPDGAETLEVDITDGSSIFAEAGNAAAADQTSNNTATLNDKADPTVTSVSSSTADGALKVGDAAVITVTFSEAVTVTGTPQLTLETGTTDRTINYNGTGSGTTTLEFSYTVQAGDVSADLDYVATNSLTAGTSIQDAAGNNATLTLASPGAANSLGNNKALVIDGVVPTVTSVTSTTANGTLKVGDAAVITVTFSEAVTVTGTPQLTLETGTTDRTINYNGTGSGTTTLEFGYTVQAGDVSADLDYVATNSLTAGTSIQDAAGNNATLTLASPGAANSLGNNKALVIDGVVPTVTSVTSTTANGTLKVGDAAVITVTFSEAVTVTGTPQLTLETGTTDRTINYNGTGSGTTTLEFGYTVQAGDNSADLDYVATTSLTAGTSIQDATGNDATLTLASPGAANSLGANKALVIDGVVPTVTSVTSTTANGSFKVGDAVVVTVTFSEAVTVTGTPQLTLETGTTDRTINYNGTGSGTTTLEFGYTVQAGDNSADLDYVATNSLTAGTSIQDAAGNNATLTLATPGATNSLGDNKALVIDGVAPTVTDVSIPNAAAKVGDAITVSITASEAGLSLNAGQVNGVNVTGFSDDGGGSYSATYTVVEGNTDRAAGADVPVSFILQDAAGNNSATFTTAISQAADAIDANSPSVTSVGMTNAAAKVGDAIAVSITASEAGLSLNTGTVNGVNVTGFTDNGGGSYSATYTVAEGNTDRAAGDDVPVNFILQDAASNTSATFTTAISQASDAIDANSPTVANVSMTNAAAKVGDAITVSIAASEGGLSLNTGQVNGVNVTGFTDNGGGAYTATYTVASGNTDRAAGDDVPVNFIMADAAGNNSATFTTAISQASDAIDANAPTITNVTIPNAAAKVGDAITVSITASEAGLSLNAGQVNGVNVTGFSDDGGGSYSATYTVVEGNTDRAAGADVPVSFILQDAAGNNSATFTTAISQASDAIDANSPSVTSVGMTNAAAKVGDAIAISITAGEAGLSLNTGTVNGVNVTGFTDNGGGAYTATYTVAEGNTDRAAGDDVPVNFILQDAASNTSATFTTAISQASDAIDANSPTVANVSMTNAAAKVGDAITVSIAASEGGLSLNTGTVNGVNVTGFTDNGGGAYTATYTVASGNTDRAAGDDVPVNFIMADAAGNNSATFTTAISQASDAIDANAPTITNVSIPNATAKVGDAVTVTITAGEAGLSLNTGQVNGVNVTGFSDDGGGSYSATYTVVAGNTNRAAGDDVPVNFIFEDAAGNNSATFTTAISQAADAIDASLPTINSTSPVDNATDVGIAGDITITFNEDIAFGTGNITLVDITGAGTNTIVIDAASPGSQASISGAVLTISPTAALELNNNYAVQIAASAIDDSAGNSFAGITDNTTFNFTTINTSVAFSSTTSNGAESTASANLEVTLNAISGVNVTVDYAVTGTATGSGTDYTLANGTLTINAGDLTNNITIASIIDDALDEVDETVIVTLSNPTNAGLGTNQVHTYTINDDDPTPTVSFNSTASNGAESTASANLQVDLSATSGQNVTVDFTVTGTAAGSGTDYTLANGTLTITAGSANDNITIASIVEDALDETDETVIVTLSSPNNATLGTNTVHTYTINDNDATPTVAFSGTTSSAGESASNGILQVALSAVSGQDVMVNYTVAGTASGSGTDYTLANGSVTITAGNSSELITIASIVGDALDEDDETVIVTLSSPTNASLGTNTQHTYTILDDDATPTIAFTSTTSSGAESVSSANLQVALSAVSGRDVNVSYTVTGTATGSGTDYTLADGTLTITASNSSNNITIASIIEDALDELDETVIVTLSSPTNATLGTNTQHTYTITDNDAEPTVAFALATDGQSESEPSQDIQVSLSAVSGKTVTVNYAVTGTATAGGTDHTTVGGTITFNPGDQDFQQQIVGIVDDLLDEENETIILTLSSPSNATLGAQTTHTYTITDNDAAPTVSLSVDNSSINEASGTATLTATLSAVSGKDVTVTIGYSGTAVNGTDYNSSASTTIVINAGSLSADAAVIITPVNDGDPEANETIIAEITNVNNGTENGTQTQTITIVDDDTPNLTFTTASSNGAESVSSAGITVDLSLASGLTVTADYVLTGTATEGTDYTLAAGTLTFNPGDVQETITIAGIIDDAILEANETVIITLSNLSNANAGTNQMHTYTINDNDAAAVTIADIAGAENGGDITVTATLDNAVEGGFTVDVSTADGTATTADSDYTAVTSQTLTFAGNAGETQTFTITPTADTKLEDNETLTVSQGNLAATSLSVDISDGATVTINNDDVAAVTIEDVSGAEAGGAITLTATLDNAVQGGFSVDVSTADGTALSASDYTVVSSQTLNFAGTAGETQTFTVTPTDDAIEESTEALSVSQGNLSGTTLVIDVSDGATVTINDEDDNTAPTGFTVTWDDVEIGAAEAGSASFTFAGAEVGTTYNYSISSSGGGSPVTGTGTIVTPTDMISTIDVSTLSDGSLTLSVTLTDASSNESSPQTDLADLDTAAPTGTTVETIDTDTGEANDDEVTSDNTLTFAGLAEVGSLVEIFIEGTSIGTTTATDVGDWTFDHTATTLADGSYAVTAKATDTFGNAGQQGAALTVLVDTGVPDVSVTTSAGSLVNGAFSVTITYNEQVNNVAQSDVSIGNGAGSNFTPVVAGQSWTLDITPTADGQVTVKIPVATANDDAGNGNNESNTLALTFDGTAPTVTSITRVDANPTQLAEVDFSVVFSEEVNNVDATDFEIATTGTITGESITNILPVSPSTYTVTVNRGSGEGTFGLNLKDDDSITDNASNHLGDTGLGNGDFTGEVYSTNSSPTDIGLDVNSIDENNALSEAIGNLSTTDADGGDTHTYALAAGTGDDNNGSFMVTSTGGLFAAEVFNFENKTSYTIRVETDDGKGGTFQKAFTISINDVNETPTDIELSNNDIDESDETGLLVGTLSSIDVDDSETFTYTLNIGDGDDNNLLFTIANGNELRTAGATNFEDNTSLSIRIRVTDSGGLFYEEIFSITVNDISVEPLRDFDKDEADARVKNFFTPNGDGTNDLWIVEDILDNPINEVKVYSQAGKLIFSQRNYENDWDGTFDGEPIPPGTYYYEINIYNGESIIRGFLTIIRN